MYSQHVLPVHFGLAEASIIEKITVRWLNGQIDVIENVSVNQSLKIREFDGLVVNSEIETLSPNNFRLFGNYPNPFNAGTVIQFELSQPQKIGLEVFDVLGRMIYIKEAYFNSGLNTFRWNPGNINSGIYFYRISNSRLSKGASLLFLK